MEIRTWTPNSPVGDGDNIAAHTDPAIYKPAFERRWHFAGNTPPAIDEALNHCTRQVQIREIERMEMSADPPVLDPVDQARHHWVDAHPATLRVELSSPEVSRLVPASRLAERATKATRALLRVLLRKRPA